MSKCDSDRIVFYSVHDMSVGHFLSKSEPILKKNIVEDVNNVNDVLELYHIKRFFDNGVYSDIAALNYTMKFI